MKEQLIEFETAKLAKEKGFNLYSQGWYGCDDPMEGKPNKFFIRNFATWEEFGEEDSQEGTEIYSAPTQSLLQKWLRDSHKIDTGVSYWDDGTYSYRVKKIVKGKMEFFNRFVWVGTYEETLEIGLMEALRQI